MADTLRRFLNTTYGAIRLRPVSSSSGAPTQTGDTYSRAVDDEDEALRVELTRGLSGGDIGAHTHAASDIVSGNLDYARMPIGNGSWDTGVGTTISIARALTVIGALAGTLATASQPNVTTMANLTTVGTVSSGTWQATPVVTTYGGTGLSSYAAGDTVYYASGTALSKLTIGATNRVLTSSGSAPQWSASLTGINTTGSAATLTTPRTIWGQSFDGSANVSGALSGATTGDFSSTLTAQKVSITGGSSAAATLFKHSIDGLSIRGTAGSTYDLSLVSASDSYLLANPTGTIAMRAFGAWTFDSTINGQTISSAANLTGTLAIAGAITSTATATNSFAGQITVARGSTIAVNFDRTGVGAASLWSIGAGIVLGGNNDFLFYDRVAGATVVSFGSNASTAVWNSIAHTGATKFDPVDDNGATARTLGTASKRWYAVNAVNAIHSDVTTATMTATDLVTLNPGAGLRALKIAGGAIASWYDVVPVEVLRVVAAAGVANYTLQASGQIHSFNASDGNPIVRFNDTSKTFRAYGASTFDTSVTQTAGTYTNTAATQAVTMIGAYSADTHYGAWSFNNSLGAGLIGLAGGATGDSSLYYKVPTGGSHKLEINSASKLTLSASSANLFSSAHLFESSGDYTLTARILPTVTVTQDIGTSGVRWRTLYAYGVDVSNNITTPGIAVTDGSSTIGNLDASSTSIRLYGTTGKGFSLGVNNNAANVAQVSSAGAWTFQSTPVDGVTTFTATGKIQTTVTTEQMRLRYDSSNYFSTTVASSGSTTFALTGTAPTFTFSQAVAITGSVTATSDIMAGAATELGWTGRATMKSPSDGVIGFYNDALSDFTRLQFGGTTSSFPSIKRSGAVLQARLADDSDHAFYQGKYKSSDGSDGITGAGGAVISITVKNGLITALSLGP